MTSSRTALIEMIPDTLSIHALKARSPASMSLRNHFYAKFVRVCTPLLSPTQVALSILMSI